jgi:hypothetical protein
MIKKLTFLLLLFGQVLSAQQSKTQLSWPEITRENKPWTRWWWPGSIVSKPDLSANMEKYQKAGLGGLEVTVIYGAKGMEDKFINYLSPQWMDMFTYTLKEGERLNLGIELANASGWPFGGPWVKPEDACRNINYKTWNLKEGVILAEPVTFIQQPLVRAIGLKPDIKKLTDPIATNDSLQIYALDQIRFEKPIPLQVLMAYSDNGESLDLTNKVNSYGKLDWVAPKGNWTLYGLFEGWHGKQVERAGPGGEGDVIDHFSSNAIDKYLSHFEEAFKNYDIRYLSGYFNDSYEVDDASGQSNWTPLLFDEFKARRGYDLRENLPALFQKDNPEKNARILCDYRQTISDLLLEKYTTRWTAWAHKQGKTTRNQSHGAPANILDLYAATDIPETEGAELTKLKFATSAGNVTGKKYVSSESATWLNEHFSSSLSDVKKAIDPFFLAGVNHIFYHGTCYSPVNQPWPGFQFYASVEFSPQNSFWNDFEGLNKYVARVQSFLQRGKPDNDILLYFPIYDRYSDYGRDLLEHFDAVSPAFNGTPFRTAADEMLNRGYTFDYISDLQLQNTNTSDGLLKTEGGIYKTVIVPGCKYITVETFEKVLKLAEEGGQVIFYVDMPENISGWDDYLKKSDIFSKLKAGLKFTPIANTDSRKAIYGKGKIFIGASLEQLLSEAGISRETMTDNSIKFNRRKYGNGYCYFVVNKGTTAFDGWLPVGRKASSAGLLNPMTGDLGLSKTRNGSNGLTEVYTRINPEESFIIVTFDTIITGKGYSFYNAAAVQQEITGSWKVEFIEGGPSLPETMVTGKLISWTEFGGEQVKDFSGTALYSINFKKPSGNAEEWVLNLGKVCESARVKLNGKEVAILIGPDYQVIINNKQFKDDNILEIKVSNLAINRVAYADKNNIPWKIFYNINMSGRLRQSTKNGIFDASGLQPRESGLLGPVTITPMKIMK